MSTKRSVLNCLFFAMLLSGCAQQNTDYNAKEFAKGQQAIVMFKAAVSLTSQMGIFGSHNSSSYLILNWKNDTSQVTFSNQKVILFPWANPPTYDVMQVQPGIYSLESCQYRGDHGVGGYYIKTYTPQKKLITFSIKPGEAMYLGDIYLDDTDSKGHFEFTDSFSTAQQHIKENHPELSSRLQKNIIRPVTADPEFVAAMNKAARKYLEKKK